MKNVVIIILLVLISSTFSLSQSPLWQKTNDSFNEHIITLTIDGNGHIFAVTNNGIYHSKDKGKTWQSIGLQNKSVSTIAINSKGDIYAGLSREGVLYSTDEGQTWTQINAGLDSSSYGDIIVYDLTFDKDDNLFAIGRSGIYRLMPNALTWERIHFQNSYATCFTFSPKGDIYVGLSNSTLVKSSDNAASWQEINKFPPYAGIASLAVNSQDHIFVSLWDSEGAGLYFSEQLRSTDNGKTWVKINTPVRNNDEPVHFAINNPGYIFSWSNWGSYAMLAISFDNGMTWTKIDNGIEHDSLIEVLAFSPDGSIYIGTYNDGIYRNVVDFSSGVKASLAKPDYYNLFQNYPNPFNAQTIIKYSLPNQTHISLLIYDINGKLVRTLLDEIENNGTHQVVWDGLDDNGRQIGSGVYLLRMKAGDYSSFRKLTIIK